MKLEVEIAVACLIGLIWIQQIMCDELSNTTAIDKWTCSCSSMYQGNQSDFIKTNCSTSCDCNPVAGGSSRWTCICAADGFPKVAANNHDPNCFTACSCSYGSLAEAHAPNKHFSSKVVVIILSVCVILTTLAFISSITCYFYRKDKCPIQTPVFSSERETSCNSSSNLITHKTSSTPEWIVNVSSPINPVIGCFWKASFLFRNKTRNINGSIIQFSLSQLEYATDKFSNSNLVGVGGCSYVYRGQLQDGRLVAVKRLKTLGGPDADSVFSTEVELLSRLHHCHVVPLLGYCSEFQGKHAERLLVFEYMPRGNLRDCLDGDVGENMNWETRVAIAIGAAKGLEYLHEAAAPRILHRDVKSTNILLDGDWVAKITDLGMAKCLKADGLLSCSSSPARMQGTFGYFAPEYAILGRASLMSDVFSFGVVLLELITGRRPIHKSADKGEESLVIWATPRLKDSRRVISELPDPRLKGNFPEEEVQIMGYLAKECLLLDPDSRPTMSEVLQILSTIVPKKSKRRDIPLNLFQKSSTHKMNNELYIEQPGNPVESPVAVNEMKQDKSNELSDQSSLPLDIERTLCIETKSREIHTVSTEYVERIIRSTSKSRKLLAMDDEKVDLTEPRFESFCMADPMHP